MSSAIIKIFEALPCIRFVRRKIILCVSVPVLKWSIHNCFRGSLCIDVTVVSPLATNNQPYIIVGKIAKDAELRTHTHKHLKPCEQIENASKLSRWMYLESRRKKSRGLLRRIETRLVRFEGYPTYNAAATCLRRVSFAAHLGVARQGITCHEVVVLGQPHDGRPVNCTFVTVVIYLKLSKSTEMTRQSKILNYKI